MTINSFNFGFVVVDGKQYISDVLILPDGTVTERERFAGRVGSHHVRRAEVERMLKARPDAILLGCGTSWLLRLSEEAEVCLRQADLSPILLSSPLAVQKYNELTGEGKRVAALFHITC